MTKRSDAMQTLHAVWSKVDPQTNKQTNKHINKHTNRQGRIQHTAQLSVQCSKLCGWPPQHAPAPCKLWHDIHHAHIWMRDKLHVHVGLTWTANQSGLVTLTLTFDLESGVRITCDVGYLSTNFSFPRPLCSRLRPDVHDRHMSDVRHASSLNAPYQTVPVGAGA